MGVTYAELIERIYPQGEVGKYLVDTFARQLKLAVWYTWKADTPPHDTAD